MCASALRPTQRFLVLAPRARAPVPSRVARLSLGGRGGSELYDQQHTTVVGWHVRLCLRPTQRFLVLAPRARAPCLAGGQAVPRGTGRGSELYDQQHTTVVGWHVRPLPPAYPEVSRPRSPGPGLRAWRVVRLSSGEWGE